MNKEDIIQNYSNYDSSDCERKNGIKIIINALSNIRREPKLFEFVINILREQFACSFNNFFVIECDKDYERVYNWIFNSFKDAEICITNLFNVDTNESIPNNMLFESYRIRKI
jgi:hypothetical protein